MIGWIWAVIANSPGDPPRVPHPFIGHTMFVGYTGATADASATENGSTARGCSLDCRTVLFKNWGRRETGRHGDAPGEAEPKWVGTTRKFRHRPKQDVANPTIVLTSTGDNEMRPMKHAYLRLMVTRLLVVFATLTASPFARAQKPQLTKVDFTQAARKIPVYRIQDGEIAVGGDVIKRVEIGKTTAVITYFNKYNHPAKPSYTFRLINAYGIEIGGFEDKWMLDKINPGEAAKEDKTFYLYPLNRILEFSGISLPDDWAVPVYLIIE